MSENDSDDREAPDNSVEMRTWLALCAVVAFACNGVDRTPRTSGTGGAPQNTGGAPQNTGGAPGTGGIPSSTGGATGGSSASGGSGGQITAPDASSSGSDGAASPDAASPDGAPSLMECSQPSVDRITWWQATGEGTTTPMKEGTSLLVKEGDHYVAREQFLKNEWHVLEVIITNAFGKSADLSQSSGFTLSYNSTADLYIQLRPGFAYDGGEKWVIRIPSSNGQDTTQAFPFTGWTTIDELGKPSYTFAKALAAAEGFVFVGKTPNVITLRSLRIAGYTPDCK